MFSIQKLKRKRIIPPEIWQNIKTKVFLEEETKNLIIEVTTEVLTEKLQDTEKIIEVKIPATWWDMFKKQYFPKWLLRKFPVKHKTLKKRIRFERIAVYPTLTKVPFTFHEFYHKEDYNDSKRNIE